MDYFDLSVKSKRRLARWINKRPRTLLISELVKNSRDERQLFKMCRFIDRWYDEHEPYTKPLEASTKLSEEIDEVHDEAPTTSYVVPEKHTRLRQHKFSRHVSSRLNTFITNNPEVCISKMLSEAATEDDLMKAMDEIESRNALVDPEVKRWTVRVH